MSSLLLTAFLVSAQVAPGDAPASPAQLAEAAARAAIAERPGDARAWTRLGVALSRRAREAADPEFYSASDEALARALELAPGDFEARRFSVWNQLGRHEFGPAREAAVALNREVPDDVLTYGLIVDACVELGRYDQAVDACQWMLNLKPGNVPALTRAAYLRELNGNLEGALELMQMAYEATQPDELEDRAWMLVQIAHLSASRGEYAAAGLYVEQALATFPDYHYALAERGRLALAEGRAEDAVAAFRRRFEVAPHPENLRDLGEALLAAGREAEAAEAFAEFLEGARAESLNADNANRELCEHLLERDGSAAAVAEALALLTREREHRGDAHTRLLLARALHASGARAEAHAEATVALSFGLRDAECLAHAAEIARDAGDAARARELALAVIGANPRSPAVDGATRLLASLAEEPAEPGR